MTMEKGRVEAFSDGVIAVAITLLALNLPIPDPSSHGTLARNLGSQWPEFAAFAVSFLTIGIIWINHHATLRRLVGVDHTTLILNLMLLMSVCALPFSTALMAKYLRASGGQHLAAAIYGGSFLVMALFFFALQVHVLRLAPHLARRDLARDARDSILRRNATGLIPYVIATAVAAWSAYVTLIIAGVIAVYYASPPNRPDAPASAPEPAEDREQ